MITKAYIVDNITITNHENTVEIFKGDRNIYVHKDSLSEFNEVLKKIEEDEPL